MYYMKITRSPFLGQFYLHYRLVMKACERLPFLIKVIRKGCLLFPNGIQKGKSLDLRTELTCITVCRISFQAFNLKFNCVFQEIFLQGLKQDPVTKLHRGWQQLRI